MPARICYSKGQVLGDHGLVFLEEAEPHVRPSGVKERMAVFLCPHCGAEWAANITNVKGGQTKSCGCLQRKAAAKTCKERDSSGESNGNWKAGASRHYLWSTWVDMKRRCFNRNRKDFYRYGGRGITVHEPWVNDARAFVDWMDENLGPRPEGHSIDRIDNDGNYEPGNLRWADQKTQSQNRGRHIKNKIGGQS